MDIAGVRTAEGKLSLFVAIDRTITFTLTQLVEKADRRTAWAVPSRIHTIHTDNGIQCAGQPGNRTTVH